MKLSYSVLFGPKYLPLKVFVVRDMRSLSMFRSLCVWCHMYALSVCVCAYV